MNTKSIARLTGLSVSAVNAAARDLGIATYDRGTHCWRVTDRFAPAFTAMLQEA